MGRRPTKKPFKHIDILSLKQHTKQVSPPKVAIRSEQPLADCFILDESIPHLRAAAVLYADAQADGMKLYREDQSLDKIEPNFRKGRGSHSLVGSRGNAQSRSARQSKILLP